MPFETEATVTSSVHIKLFLLVAVRFVVKDYKQGLYGDQQAVELKS